MSASASASASTSTKHLDVLIDEGTKLAKLLREVKKKDSETSTKTAASVKDIVSNVSQILRNSPSDSAEESRDKLVIKIGVMLQDFVKYDFNSKSEYENLMKEVSGFLNQNQASDAPSGQPGDSDSNVVISSPEINESEERDIESAVEKLPNNEKKCLSYFLLFPAEAELKKREIIHCWVGMDLTDDKGSYLSMNWDRLLAKFVAMGLIDRTFLHKKLLNRYKMPKSVHSTLSAQSDPSARGNDGSWSILRHEKEGNKNKNSTKKRSNIQSMTMRPSRGTDDQQKAGKNETLLIRTTTLRTSLGADGYDDPEALLNVDQTTLNAARFKTISEMDKLKVVHLGGWRQSSSKYIVVEDIDAFKHLKSLSRARFLSLEGVSGMVNLPESVYELQLLKVLDLRACNNLEIPPDGIKSLLNLTHLDLSKCYLLEHIPFGITFLTKLQVLKGFIININHMPKQDGKGKGERKENGREGKGKGIPSSSPCPFEQLSKLKELRKLTIITRRMSFPTAKDIEIFAGLEHLSCLRITWVGNSSTEVPADVGVCVKTFPPSLRKLELQAVSNDTAARLLRLMSENTSNCSLEKLYIIGGGLRELKDAFPQLTVVRLKYLLELQIDWDDFQKLFPNLDRLEVSECPNLILFQCDENGVWEQTHQSIIDEKVDEE